MNHVAQRWRNGGDRYRPPDEVIQTRHYDVQAIADDTTPKAFVCAHHYSATYPAARFRYGLYRGGELVGVAVFSVPANDRVITNVLPGTAIESVELGRFVLLDFVPGNGETWMLGRCFELLRKESLIGVVSFSDPVPRMTVDGVSVLPGHVGTIYQAFNGRYTGRGTARTLSLLPDGRVFSDRCAQKIRKLERGWMYSAKILERFGAPELRPESHEHAAAWLRTWLPRLTRRIRHAGNHRYIWALDKRARRHLPVGLPFPKQIDAG